MRYYNYDIVFQEIPNEVTLAINISGCPNKCKGCHSPHLWDDVGAELNFDAIRLLLEQNEGITCVCFMGGDNDIKKVFELASFLFFGLMSMKLAWYTGYNHLEILDMPEIVMFDYIKTGRYIEKLGGLDSPTTNQRFFKHTLDENKWEDLTYMFQK